MAESEERRLLENEIASLVMTHARKHNPQKEIEVRGKKRHVFELQLMSFNDNTIYLDSLGRLYAWYKGKVRFSYPNLGNRVCFIRVIVPVITDMIPNPTTIRTAGDFDRLHVRMDDETLRSIIIAIKERGALDTSWLDGE